MKHFVHIGTSNPTRQQILEYMNHTNAPNKIRKNRSMFPLNITYKIHKKFLKPEICIKLRQFARKEFQMEIQTNDTVDDELEWQVNLSKNELKNLLGKDLYKKIWKITNIVPESHNIWSFIRRYTKNERQSIKLHFDDNVKTININLATIYRGNKLCTITKENSKLSYTEHNFELGDLITHNNLLAHAVTPIECGIRYSLIIFFEEKKTHFRPHHHN